jgi:hypothetical protein
MSCRQYGVRQLFAKGRQTCQRWQEWLKLLTEATTFPRNPQQPRKSHKARHILQQTMLRNDRALRKSLVQYECVNTSASNCNPQYLSAFPVRSGVIGPQKRRGMLTPENDYRIKLFTFRFVHCHDMNSRQILPTRKKLILR